MPLPCVTEALCFWVVVRVSVRAFVSLARFLTNQWTEFHQTLVDDVVEGTDKLVGFWRSKVKVKVTAGQIFE